MRLMDETGDALALARVDIRELRFIGSGHMDRTLPMRDVVVLTWPDKLPSEITGFKRMPDLNAWWRSEDGRNIFICTTAEELKRWSMAADVVRLLHFSGVTMTRELRIGVYRTIVDNKP